MTARKPIVLGTDGAHQQLQDGDALLIGNATLDTSALTAPHSLALPNKSGTLATLDDVAAGAGSVGAGGGDVYDCGDRVSGIGIIDMGARV